MEKYRVTYLLFILFASAHVNIVISVEILVIQLYYISHIILMYLGVSFERD